MIYSYDQLCIMHTLKFIVSTINIGQIKLHFRFCKFILNFRLLNPAEYQFLINW